MLTPLPPASCRRRQTFRIIKFIIVYFETHVQLKWDNIDRSKVCLSRNIKILCAWALDASAINAKVMRIHTKLTAIKLAFSLAIIG